jgi:flagellar P-ring protein precursor FlgI
MLLLAQKTFALRFLLVLYLALLGPVRTALAEGARIKDLVMVAGARDNQLVGYGLVSGLAGDGDKNLVFTLQTMGNMLQRFGVTVSPLLMQSKNMAAVMVTADIPAFAKEGSRLDVMISAIGDAKSLQGGVLLETPLWGADGKVYAVAQGATSLGGGFAAGTGGGGGASVQKNHPTVAQIIGGALVEHEIPATIIRENCLELLLRDPDFTSAARLAAAINEKFPDCAQPLDSSSVKVRMPAGTENSPIDFIARLEALEITPDTPARIIINERTGTIVANARIRISHCAVSHGNLIINIASTLNVSQPSPLSQTGTTKTTPTTNTKVTEPKARLIDLPEMPSVERVAAALNTLGVTPRDMMAIFQAMKQAGALQAELLMR